MRFLIIAVFFITGCEFTPDPYRQARREISQKLCAAEKVQKALKA